MSKQDVKNINGGNRFNIEAEQLIISAAVSRAAHEAPCRWQRSALHQTRWPRVLRERRLGRIRQSVLGRDGRFQESSVSDGKKPDLNKTLQLMNQMLAGSIGNSSTHGRNKERRAGRSESTWQRS